MDTSKRDKTFNPLVTVNILSYNRKEELRVTIQKVYEQDYKNIEVIVVDNTSTDGTPEMVEKEFPQVELIKLKKNIGIAGWNEGFKIAKGEYVLVLDDDAYPANNSIRKAVSELKSNNQVACITFNIYDVESSKQHKTNWQPDEEIFNKTFWPVFIGCAAMFSKNKLKEVMVMPEEYFLNLHELPISADIHSYGYKILFNKEIIAFHNFNKSSKYNEISDQIVFKNCLLFINEYLPLHFALLYNCQSMLYYLSRSLRRKWFKEYCGIIKRNNYFKKKNRNISIKYLRELRKLHLFNLSLISKIYKGRYNIQ